MNLQITRSKLNEIVQNAAEEAGMRMVDYETIFEALDGSKGVDFLTFGRKYGCPLTQAFHGAPDEAIMACRENEAFSFFKTLFDEHMIDYFDVQAGLGFEYCVEIL